MIPRVQRQAWVVAGWLSACALALSACGEAPADEPVRAPAVPRPPVQVSATRDVSWGRDVRPLLSDRCFQCHGQDAARRQANLRLDVAHGEGGVRGVADVAPAGAPQDSELWRRLSSADPQVRMPPPDSGKRPIEGDALWPLWIWLERGARVDPHWSFVPPVRPPLPDVAGSDWPLGAVDRFVLAAQQARGLQPAPDADRATLLRRVFLDLTGLPPTPEELDEFLADPRPDAYEAWVERLLTQEPWLTRHAERLASAWLDLARYADTNGIHTDAGRSAWPWRDWLIGAYRDNLPYDEFVVEQLAGDLLPGATQAQQVASGFHRNQVVTDEGGAIPEEYLAEYAAERVAVTGEVFLGLTLGCARCHDHKFDPLTMQDFYGLTAFFNSIDEPGLYSQEADPRRAFEPFMEVPSPEQAARRAALEGELAVARAELLAPAPEDDARHAQFTAELPRELGLDWRPLEPLAARSQGGATLQPRADGAVLAGGACPDTDVHELELRAPRDGLSLLLLEALPDPSLPEGRVGRAANGNAVLTGVNLEELGPDGPREVPLEWAWADHVQPDGDFAATHALRAGDALGWAVDAHRVPGGRALLLLAARPFGEAGGTLRLRLEYASPYAQHVLGCVRTWASPLAGAARARLPLARSDWYRVGPFPAGAGEDPYAQAPGPESDPLDLSRNFGAGNQVWTHEPGLADGRPFALTGGTYGSTFVARRLHVPAARSLPLALGSDDGLRLLLDGQPVFERRVDRSLAPDQDAFTLELPAGVHVLVAQVVNSGGEAGFFWRDTPAADELGGALLLAALPDALRDEGRAARQAEAWRLAFSPVHAARSAQVRGLEAQLAELAASVPRSMVMRERPEPRETFVLQRGQYDQPDPARPVGRQVPAALGRLPDDAPRDRRGLAQWLVSPDNPLVARVAANRLWELVFGAGLVRSSEDFGAQGEWPSHPELLDWLAVELRESGWDQRHVLRLLVTSRTYRQSSRGRPELAEVDPDNRLLARFPRRRLPAEALRDQALYLGGLLVERAGGPSVKPYQPPGLWEEVAMPASNTRSYQRGEGEDLWRRSLYTYWKRAAPPPSLLAFDAPTRETCTLRRTLTNTPLQALVLWNDEQHVEAARGLATRTLREAGDDAARLASLFRRCTGRPPDAGEVAELAGALADLRARYAAEPAAAEGVLSLGASPRPQELPTPELAAWTLLSGAVLSLDATLTRS